MTYDQFWYGDPWLTAYYMRKKEIEAKWVNEEAWLNGYYNHIAVAIAIGNAFRSKGKPATDYPKKPLQFTEPTGAEADARKRKAMQDSIDFIKRLDRRRVRNANIGQPTNQGNG